MRQRRGQLAVGIGLLEQGSALVFQDTDRVSTGGPPCRRFVGTGELHEGCGESGGVAALKAELRRWDRIASDTVAMMRTEAGRDPYDKALTDLVGELCTRSEDFRTRWAAHDVRLHRTGVKQFHHPGVGDLNLHFETMPLPADPGLAMTLLSAPAGSPDDDTLRLLASWAATRPASAPPPRR